MADTQTEITEEVHQETTMSGFAKRNANKDRIEKEEQELKDLVEKNKNPEEQDEDNSPEPEGAEEKTFKKRYGDLRRHSQKREQELQNQIDSLKEQVEASTKKEIKYPTSEAELEQWMKKYPDVAKVVETIAIKKAKEQASEFENKFKAIDEMKHEALREKAEAELMRMHPDFDSIRDDDDFHEWVEEQPKWVKDALYDNDTDAVSAARAIDLYKSDKGIRTTKKSSKSSDAARAVSTRSTRNTPESDNGRGSIRESEVARMSAQEYEQRQGDISEAIRTGKFIYDLSGPAR